RLHGGREGRNPAVRSLGAIRCRNQLGKVRLFGTGDETLHAVDAIVIAFADGDGAHAARIATGIGLRLRKAPVQLAANGREQVLFLLLVVEVIEYGAHIGAEDFNAARRQRNGAAKLRPDSHLGNKPHAKSAVFARHVIAGKPQLFGFGSELAAQLRLQSIVLAGGPLDGNELAVDKFAHCFLEHADFFRQLEAQAVDGQRSHVCNSSALRTTTRTSTAYAPAPRSRTISGLISSSASHDRSSTNS